MVWHLLQPREKRSLAGVGILMLIGMFLELLSLGLFVPMIALIAEPQSDLRRSHRLDANRVPACMRRRLHLCLRHQDDLHRLELMDSTRIFHADRHEGTDRDVSPVLVPAVRVPSAEQLGTVDPQRPQCVERH
jgi:hypothetical protein